MLEFNPVNVKSTARLRKYYSGCPYRLAEYSLGVKLMWRHYWRSKWAEVADCLVVLNHTREQGYLFDYPVPLTGRGDVDAALDAIESWCAAKGVFPTFGVVPEEERDRLLARYPYACVESSRIWQDYLYRTEDLATFAGRRYSGQRNHINKFRKLYPDAAFRPLTPDDSDALEVFWGEFHAAFNKDAAIAKKELCAARKLCAQIGKPWLKAGGIQWQGRLIAIALGEVCGSTLVCHVEKALPGFEGVYPTMVQSFAAAYRGDTEWINREDDAGDAGLRTSKLQYRPADMGKKIHITVGNELAHLDRVPRLESSRLVLDGIGTADAPAYDRLCLDDERNRWWGYDYRKDLKGELKAGYFLRVARRDFKNKLAVNFAVRLNGEFIGEAVLYNFDYKGSAELGCRIFPEYAGHGYGAEAFRRAAEWSLYELGLTRLVAKCFRENEASYKMLSACMTRRGEDETFYHFEKLI